MHKKNNFLPSEYQNFIAVSRYARWLPEENRRENWVETVQRYIDNVVVPKNLPKETVEELQSAILGLEGTKKPEKETTIYLKNPALKNEKLAL